MPPVSGLGSSVDVNLLVINVLRLSSRQAPIYYISLYRYTDRCIFNIHIMCMYVYIYIKIHIYRPHNSRPLKTQAALINKKSCTFSICVHIS